MKELVNDIWNMPLQQLELQLLLILLVFCLPVGLFILFKK